MKPKCSVKEDPTEKGKAIEVYKDIMGAWEHILDSENRGIIYKFHRYVPTIMCTVSHIR
jgi:hypothetical protein